MAKKFTMDADSFHVGRKEEKKSSKFITDVPVLETTGEEVEILTVPVDELQPYYNKRLRQNQPFKVRQEKVDEIKESILEVGLLNPIKVRPMEQGGFEILSGHTRLEAVKQLEWEEVAIEVKDVDDDEATQIMLHENIYRDEKLPSEIANAFKMEYDARKHRGKRATGKEGKTGVTIDEMGKENNMSGKKVQRYIKLADLDGELLELVDEGKIKISAGFELAYLNIETQSAIRDVWKSLGKLPNPKQIETIKSLEKEQEVTEEDVERILSPEAAPKLKFSMNEKKIYEYFPVGTTQEEVETTILKLLEDWSQNQ